MWDDNVIMLPTDPLSRAAAVGLECVERWPALFVADPPRVLPLPLCLRAGEMIWASLARSKGPHLRCLTTNQLGEALDCFLTKWTQHPLYLVNCTRAGRPRYDLNGEPWGIVTEDEAAWARDRFHEAFRRCVPDDATPQQVRAWTLYGAGWRQALSG
jgi:sRNA-binding protein